MNLTIFGANGGIGREVVTQALDAGHHVTASIRNPAKLTATHPNLTVITGELTDRDAVQRAVHGADAVISALGPSLDRKATGMPLVEGTRTIVDAMRAEGVERYIGMATPGYLGRDTIRASITRADIATFLLDQTADAQFHRAAPAISN